MILHKIHIRSRGNHRSRYLAVTAALLMAVAPLAACGSDSGGSASKDGSSTTTATSPSVKISDVWARPGTAGGNTAIYMQITAGSADVALTGVSVPADVAAAAQIHETVVAGDGSTTSSMDHDSTDHDSSAATSTTGYMEHGDSMMTMQEVDSIKVPAGESVQMKPGGYHVMVMDLKKDLVVGDTVEVTLTFAGGPEKVVSAEVREP